MQAEKLQKLTSGVLFHTHSRLDNLLPLAEARLEAQAHDSFVSTEALVWYALQFSHDPNFLICDTDHPVHVLDRKGISRKGSFAPEKIDETIKILSQGAVERAQVIHKTAFTRNIVNGIEADILDENGKLDVSDDALRQLRITMASLHPRYWKSYSGLEVNETAWMNALMNVARNPHIDVIGHPTRGYPMSSINSESMKKWQTLAATMAETGTAFEINHLDFQTEAQDFLFLYEVIKVMAKEGVHFIFGLDFHEFSDYGVSLPESTYVEKNNMRYTFKNLRKPSLFAHLSAHEGLLYLQEAGVTQQNCVTSSRATFAHWLNNR